MYSIGLSIGPSFFSSFKSGGLTLNLLAIGVVFLGAATAFVIHLVTGEDLNTMVGVLSGAVTNTPGLGAAQQTYFDANGVSYANFANGYAVAYPLGVVGIITVLIVCRYAFRINLKDEKFKIEHADDTDTNGATSISVEVTNPAVFGKTIQEVMGLMEKSCVFSRLCREDGSVELPTSVTKLMKGDRILIITTVHDEDNIAVFIGKKVDMCNKDWDEIDKKLVIRRLVVTKNEINGKKLMDLKVRTLYGVNITRVTRAGIDLMASRDLKLQLGDRLLVVGSESSINKLSEMMGNELKHLREPHLIPIFIGIALGIILGSLPIFIPGVPQAVKLGLAGGPLVVAILISYFGPKYKLITYNTISANMMLREIGISFFLAAVGLGAGDKFVESIVGGGYMWVLYGVIITIVPLVIIFAIARFVCKLNYCTIMGLIAGSTTDPPALAYSNTTCGNSAAAVAYATVYPLTMFLRILTAQMLVLIAL